MRQIPTLTDVTSDLLIENPQVTIDIDRDHAGELGVTAAEIENTLYDAFGQRQVSTIYTPTNEYWVVMEVLPQYQQDIASLGSLWLRPNTSGAGSGAATPGNVGTSVAPSTGAALVPLSAVASFHNDVGPVTVNHSGQLPSITISFDLAPGASLGSAIKAIQQAAAKTMPSSIGAAFTGTAAAYETTQQNLLILIGLAVFVIYLILGVLYESFIHPLTILSGLPFAAFGALLTLLICGLDLDMYGLVGIIMLIGIVKKNAIMMIDFAIESERAGGKTPEQAILEASSVRFRPIMMTTMAALMGALPIALGFGAGSATRRPLGVAVVGGLAFSQAVTLYVTPVFYTYLDELQTWFESRAERRRARNAARAGAPTAPARSPTPAPAGD